MSRIESGYASVGVALLCLKIRPAAVGLLMVLTGSVTIGGSVTKPAKLSGSRDTKTGSGSGLTLLLACVTNWRNFTKRLQTRTKIKATMRNHGGHFLQDRNRAI